MKLNLSFSSNSEFPSYWSTMSNVFYSSTYTEIHGNPDLKPFLISLFSAAGVEPDKKRTSYSGKYLLICAAFWRASTSVGDSIAA